MRKFLPILKILLYNPKIQINRHFMEHIRPPKFVSSFVSAGAHIDHMASYCPCVFGVHRNYLEQVTCTLVVTIVGALTCT